MKNIIDVIILSLAIDGKTFLKTKKCVESYINTAGDLIGKIIVVESNSNFDDSYGNEKVKVIKPNEKFNYNKFFNIALSECESKYIMGPNNDLEVQPNCIQTMIEELEKDNNLSSLCPIDRNWHRHTKMYLPNDNKVYYGYDVSLHMFGCVFCCKREVFNKIGFLDERFHFFYQDNDYALCLQRNELIHGVHTGARVLHKSGGTDEIAPEHCKYTPKNMNEQGDILSNKWNNEPFKSGGYKKYKEYNY